MLVRHVQGTFHGFLDLRSEDGHVVASGDVTQVVHGDRVTLECVFHFKDGSLDDETTVYAQHRTFQLITDHHVQKGPFFLHPVDTLVDARSGQFTVRTTGKDGKEDVKTHKLKLPADLANGLVPLVIENLGAAPPVTRVSMVVATPEPRLVRLAVSNMGEEDCSVAGLARKAIHYEIKIELGGVVGVVAPLIGKAPPNIEVWTIGGPAPVFVREQGPLFMDGPVMTIQLASPDWAQTAK